MRKLMRAPITVPRASVPPPGSEHANDRIEDRRDDLLDHRVERSSDDDGNRKVDHVAAHQKLFEALEHRILLLVANYG